MLLQLWAGSEFTIEFRPRESMRDYQGMSLVSARERRAGKFILDMKSKSSGQI